MNKFFQKAISDIKKQKEKEKEKEPVVSKTDDKECELSSDEEKRLKDLGALKSKPIHKEEKEVRKWKHDKYIPKESQKSANSTLEERTIYF